jgi:hypothetical protein
MATTELSIPKLAIKAGIAICISFIAYFMVMKYLDLLYMTELRFLNIFILITGLIVTFRYYRKQTNVLNVPYFEGLGLGLLTSFVSFALFAVFIYFYFLEVDPALLQSLKGNTVMLGNTSMNALYTAATVVLQGMVSGLIVSFVIMQYYKSGFYKTLNEKRKEGVRV